MKLKPLIAALGLLALAATTTVNAEPFNIAQPSAGSTQYAFVQIRAKKLRTTVAQATADLVAALKPYGVIPCIVSSDSNAAISCGKPANAGYMLPMPNEFFSYDLAFNYQDLPPIRDKKVFNKDGAYNQVYAVNFRQPVGNTVGDTMGRNPAHVLFADPVTEFSVRVDVGNSGTESIQFIVNGVALPPQAVTADTPLVMGVADPAGFTEVAIVAIGGTRAFIAGEFTILPMP